MWNSVDSVARQGGAASPGLYQVTHLVPVIVDRQRTFATGETQVHPKVQLLRFFPGGDVASLVFNDARLGGGRRAQVITGRTCVPFEIGRESCGERGCQDVWISGVAASL